ncbi:MAG TPA: carboxypeptidase regulatory-like domain-containing protein, partial [Terriglobales bacterium]
MNKRVFLFVSIIAVLLLSLAANTFGQMTTTAVVRGTVTDRQGAVVPQAGVTARNVNTGVAFPTHTNQSGVYDFASLPPGTYDVQVQARGFAEALATAVHINVGDRRDLNFSLIPAGETTTVRVTAEAPLMETTRTDVSTIVDEKQMRDLPVTSNLAVNSVVSPSNDYMNLATTAPGVRFDTTGNLGQDAIGPGYGNSRGTVVNVDGSNIMDQIVTARNVMGASLDEVQEFQVLTNNYNAEYGQAGGMIVNVITKSGTNGFHGDGHAYFRGRNLEASNYFYNLGFFQQTPQELA